MFSPKLQNANYFTNCPKRKIRIARMELFHVAIPLLYSWRTAYEENFQVHLELMCMFSGELSAWGESILLAARCYSPEFAVGVFAAVRDRLTPKILGADIKTRRKITVSTRYFHRERFCKRRARFCLVGTT